MAPPRRYSDELRERATRMALEAIAVEGHRIGPIRRIAGQSDIHVEALPSWVKRAEINFGQAPGPACEITERIAELERESRERRRADEVVTTSAAFFAQAELDRTTR